MNILLSYFVLNTLLFLASCEVFRVRRQADLATKEGVDIPVTLRSAITCLVPGIRENICLGPRVQLLKKERIGQTSRNGAFYGVHDGVDIRLLRKYNLPMIEDETEIGESVGAVVDVTNEDGAVEFGARDKIFKAWKANRGGIVEWDREGAGVDVGARASVADDLIKLRHTLFGVNVGPSSRRSIVGPYQVGETKGQYIKEYTPTQSLYHGYYSGRGDWYKSQFYRPGDEYRTREQRACPWCFAVDPSYPTQTIFNPYFG